MDMRLMYLIRDTLVAIKRELDEKGLTFDEFLAYYEKAIENVENSCRA